MPKLLILAGLALIGLGRMWMRGERLGPGRRIGRPPGDVMIERGNVRIHFPLATSLAPSVVPGARVWRLNR